MQALILSLSLFPASTTSPDGEIAKFEGRWTVLAFGEVHPKELSMTRVESAEGMLFVTRDRGFQAFQMKLDPANPGAIDLVQVLKANPTGNTLRGIYRFEGDMLKICWSTDPDAPRPTQFVQQEGQFLIVVRRPTN